MCAFPFTCPSNANKASQRMASTPIAPLRRKLKQTPSYAEVRCYMTTFAQRVRLGQFINAGWTPAEFAEYARDLYLAPQRTYPTKASYRAAVATDPRCPHAKAFLALLREPGFVMPPFDRPRPRPIPADHPDNPNHTAKIRSDVEEVAQRFRNRQAQLLGLPWPSPAEPISLWLWRRCCRLRYRHLSLSETLALHNLRDFAHPAGYAKAA